VPSEITELVFFADKGVAVGCGWQALVAYINIGCYYFIGVPLGVLLGFKFDYGIKVLLSSISMI
jgi:Na+-driven multidrug efflux pump